MLPQTRAWFGERRVSFSYLPSCIKKSYHRFVFDLKGFIGSPLYHFDKLASETSTEDASRNSNIDWASFFTTVCYWHARSRSTVSVEANNYAKKNNDEIISKEFEKKKFGFF